MAFDLIERDPKKINQYVKVDCFFLLNISHVRIILIDIFLYLKVLFYEAIAEPDENSYSINW